MDYNNVFLNSQPKYVRRRIFALLLVGLPMAWASLKLLGLVIRFFLYAGIY